MLKIYVENTHNHLTIPGKHSLWPPEHLLHVLLVPLADLLADPLADGPSKRLIDYLIPPLMIARPSVQTQMTHAV